MATTTSTRAIRSERSRTPLTFPVLLGLLCLVGGLSLALTAVEQLSGLGGDAPYVSHLLALDAPASGDLAEVLGPAGDRVDNMTYVLAMAGTALSAILLLVAAGFFLTSAQLRHPDAARRVAAVGLWLAVGVALVSIIPFDAGWGEAGLGHPTGGVSVEGLATGLIALAGLLVLQISAPQWRDSVREAFRD